MIVFRPLRQPDLLDIGVHGFGDGFVHVHWPSRAEHARRERSVGHQGCALGDLVADLPESFDVRIIQLAEVIPDGGGGRNNVGLVAAIGDYVMRALLQAQMLAAEIPTCVHQFHGVQSAAAAPGSAGTVRAFAFEQVLDRDQAAAQGLAPRGVEFAAHVREQRDIDVLEISGAYEIGFRSQQFFGYTRPDLDGALNMLAFHEAFHGERGDDIHGLPGIVTFAVSRRAFDHRIVIGDAGFLRGLRNAIDIGAQRDDRLAGSPGGDPGGGNSGDAAFHFETFRFEHPGEVLRSFVFLKTEFGEAEDGVDHDLHLVAHALDLAGKVGLHGFFFGGIKRAGDGGHGENDG